MALPFENEDDVDRQLKKERMSFVGEIVAFLSFAGLFGLMDWLFREPLKRYEETLAFLIAAALAHRYVSPLYYEFRYRTKEINGRLSAIEDSLKTIRKQLDDR